MSKRKEGDIPDVLETQAIQMAWDKEAGGGADGIRKASRLVDLSLEWQRKEIVST
jgi:hypothetical protein